MKKKLLILVVLIIVLLVVSYLIESRYCHYWTTTAPVRSSADYIKTSGLCKITAYPSLIGSIITIPFTKSSPDKVQNGAKIRNEMSQVSCPDEMIVDKMPSVIDDSSVIPSPKAYYIKDGKRVEIADYDAVWVNANCEVPVLEVQ
jgi:hypothetical protein